MINSNGFLTTFGFYFTAYMAAWAMFEDNYAGAAFQMVIALFVIWSGTTRAEEKEQEQDE